MNAKNEEMKALICVQGISREDKYLERELKAFLNGNSTYAKIVYIDSEKHLARKSLLGVYDRFGDWWEGVYLDKQIHIVEDILFTANVFQSAGYKVHGFGHSFGTLALLNSNYDFDKLFLCGCPLTSRSLLVRNRARICVNKYWTRAYRKLYYFWNPRDGVCCSPFGITKDYKQLENIITVLAGCGHGLNGYLPDVDKVVRLKK